MCCLHCPATSPLLQSRPRSLVPHISSRRCFHGSRTHCRLLLRMTATQLKGIAVSPISVTALTITVIIRCCGVSMGMSIICYPRLNRDEICHKTWNLAFHHCTVATDNIFILGFRNIELSYHWKHNVKNVKRTK